MKTASNLSSNAWGGTFWRKVKKDPTVMPGWDKLVNTALWQDKDKYGHIWAKLSKKAEKQAHEIRQTMMTAGVAVEKCTLTMGQQLPGYQLTSPTLF